MRRPRAAALVLVLALPVIAGCGGDDDGPPPAAPSPTEALWNPCDALDPKDVGRRFGGAVTEQNGTPTAPACSFAPAAEGDPVVDANYQIYPAGLDQIFEELGAGSASASVSAPTVRGADDARVVVDSDADQLYVSGFVQNGDLIQTVDAIDPSPYDRDRVVRAVRWALGQLSAHAQAADLS